jgi:hypothetical protein
LNYSLVSWFFSIIRLRWKFKRSHFAAGSAIYGAKEGSLPDGGVLQKKQSKVISTQTDCAAELATYTSVAPGSVDFTKGKVLLVDMGSRSTGGYSIRVASIDVPDSCVVANVGLVELGPQCVTTTALTNPYQFTFIPTLKEILLWRK